MTQPEIHIFSGLWSSFIPGFRAGTEAIEIMIDSLPDSLDAKHHVWNEWQVVANEIALKSRSSNQKPKVILIGHSNGVLACCNIAEYLHRKGVIVEYIAAIDPTAAKFELIYNNVRYLDEFWASSGFPKFTRWLTRKKRGACVISSRVPEYTNQWPTHTIIQKTATHVGISSHPQVKSRIVSRVSELI